MCLALPCRVVELRAADQALIAVAGVGKEISLALVENVAVGDYVIVHVGYALTRLDPEEAEKTLALFAELGSAALQEANGHDRPPLSRPFSRMGEKGDS